MTTSIPPQPCDADSSEGEPQVTRDLRRPSHPMVKVMSAKAPTQSCDAECPECGPHSTFKTDSDGWLACVTCGLQLEPVDVYESTRAMSEFDPNTTSGVGHGDSTGLGRKLSGSTISGRVDHAGNPLGKAWKHRGNFRTQIDNRNRAVLEGTRARLATMRIIKDLTRDQPTLQKEALFNLSKGWPEPKNRPADFQTIAQAGHPTPRESSAAACLIVAAERMGIHIPAHRIIGDLFDLDCISSAEATKYLKRSIKCLRIHLGPRARKEATSQRLDSVLNAAFDRDIRLGPIHGKVRQFCHLWAEKSGNSRILDSPDLYAACVAYELAKIEGLGMTLEDIEVAFGVSQGFRTYRAEVQDLLAFIEKYPGVLD